MKTKRSLRFITQIKENLVRSTKNFPETLFLGYVIVVLMILINRNDIEMEEPLGKVLLSLFAILPLSAVLARLEKRLRLKAKLHFGLYFVMVVLDVLFYLNLPEELNEGFFVRFNIWMLIVSSLFFLIPFLFRKDYFEVFFLKNVAIFFMTVLYVGILILGIYGIIALLEYLFEMNFNADIYADVAVAVSGFFGLTFFLGKQKIIFEEETEVDRQYPNLFRVLFSGIVIPLLLIYSFILHAYFLRLLLLQEFEERVLINLLVWYIIASISLLLLINPLQQKSKKMKRFTWLYPYVLILPTILLGMANWKLIQWSGLRISSYLNYVLIAFVVFYILYKTFSKKMYTQNILCVLLVLLAFSYFGPFDAIRLSLRSQREQLEKVLLEAGLVEYGSLSQGKEVTFEQRDLIYELAYSLENYDALDQVDYLPEGFQTEDFNTYLSTWKEDYRYFTLFDRTSILLNTKDVDYVIDFEVNREDRFVRSEGDYLFTMDSKGLWVERLGEELAFVSLSQELSMITAQNYELRNAVWVSKDYEDVQIEICIQEAYGNREGEALDLDVIKGLVLVRFKED